MVNQLLDVSAYDSPGTLELVGGMGPGDRSLPARMTSRYIASFRYGREHHWAKFHWNEGQARLRAVVPKVDGVVVWVRRLVRIRL